MPALMFTLPSLFQEITAILLKSGRDFGHSECVQLSADIITVCHTVDKLITVVCINIVSVSLYSEMSSETTAIRMRNHETHVGDHLS